MSVVFLFPGQGVQYPGMLHDAFLDHPVVAATFDEASAVLGQDVRQLDTARALATTEGAQLALLIAGVATARAFQACGVTPDMVAGLSVGTFAAATIAGSLRLRDALLLVRLRGSCMQQSAPPDSGLGAIIGLNEQQVQALVEDVSITRMPVFLALINAPRQIVIAGSRQGLESVLQHARNVGARKAEALRVNVPSHCPLMQPVADHLTQALARVQIQAPRLLYLGNRRARALRTTEEVRIELATNVAYPVRWYDLTTNLYERGARLFLEFPPGHVLTDLATETFPLARAVAVATSRASDICLLARREQEGDGTDRPAYP